MCTQSFSTDDRDAVPSAMPACQVLFYLTDVTPDTHCFSVVPESLDAKRSLQITQTEDGRSTVGGYDQEAAWHTRLWPDGVDVHAPAGSAVIQNNVNFHAATIRQSAVPRVTLHVNFDSTAGQWGAGWSNSRASEESAAEWREKREHRADTVPERLLENAEWGWLFDSLKSRPLSPSRGGSSNTTAKM